MTFLLYGALYLLLVSGCRASSELFCNCRLAHRRDTNIAIHCAKKQADSSGITCAKDTVLDLPRGYTFIPGYGLYKVYRTFKSWQDARESCAKEGTRLAVPTDKTLLEGIQQVFSSESGIWYAYIGVTDQQSDGFYRAADGEGTPFLQWEAGEPNHKTPDEHCLTVSKYGLMNDYGCHLPCPYMCERPLRVAVPQEYRWVADAGRFLRRVEQKKNYQQAMRTCQEDGGTLVITDTETRGLAVLRMLDVNYQGYWVGFTDEQVEGDFVTVTGRHLNDMEFRVWGRGEPNNNGGGKPENCIALLGVGYYNDVLCDLELPFICEIAPP